MAGKVSPRVVLTVVAFAVFVAADDLTVVTTMLRPIIGDLGIVLPDGLDDAAWIVNAYLIAFVAVMPFAGRISDVLGRRKVFIAAFVLFLVGSIIIPHSTRLGPFLFGRVLTALGGGAMLPVGMAILGDVYPVDRRARALGVLGAIETLGWVWGPLYGAMIVRFLTWRWQFYLNIPFAIVGIVAVWFLLADHDKAVRTARIDWWGAATLTIALVGLNVALLGSAEIQSVTGLDELTGGGSGELRWFYVVAVIAGVAFVRIQRRAEEPIIDFSLFRGRNLSASVVINFLVGAALVIAMVNVPLFVNVVELDIERAAVTAGWVLSALTASMALTSYLGGRLTENTWYRPPVLYGLAGSAVAFFLMGVGWTVDTAYGTMAWQLAILGAGIGLVFAPTSAAVIDAAPADRRGTAASLVVVLRLIGLSVGLSGLTAWGLFRFNQLRDTVVLPPLDAPDFAEEAQRASAELTTSALAETFVAATLVVLAALAIAALMRRGSDPPGDEAANSRLTQAPTEESPADLDPRSPSMKQFLKRNAPVVTLALAAVTVAAIVLAIVAVASASNARSDADAVQAELTELRDEVEQLRGGVALFTAQAGQLQDALGDLAPAAGAALSEATSGLEGFETSTIEFQVPIDETIEINTEVVLDRTLSVPINTTLPIDETIATTITVEGPLGIDIPLDITVPIVLDLPIDLVVDIPVNERIPIQAGVPVRLTLPISVDVAGTELATLAQSLRQGLESFESILSGLG